MLARALSGGGGGIDLNGYKVVEHYGMINNVAGDVPAFWRTSSGTAGTTSNFTGNYFSFVYSTSTITALQDAMFVIIATDNNAPEAGVKVIDGKANQVLLSGNASWATWFSILNPITCNQMGIYALVKA